MSRLTTNMRRIHARPPWREWTFFCCLLRVLLLAGFSARDGTLAAAMKLTLAADASFLLPNDQSECGEKILISHPGYLTSPNYPANYPLSQQCHWLLQAPSADQRLLINFNPHFDLEDRECKYDYIEIYDGDSDKAPRLLKHCGKIAPPPLHSTTHQVFIRFFSDYETSGAGFSIRYEINKLAHHTDCSSNLTGPSGVIRSPGYPDKYPNNLACTYTVTAPSGEEIQVVFLSFSLEPDTSPPSGVTCRYDWLELWDGYPLVGMFLGRFCGDSNPGRLISHTGILTITMTTDTAISKEGFEAQYTIRKRRHTGTCEEPLGMESGDIASAQIRSKSQYNPSWSPERSRLNYPENGWTPSEDSSKEWIEVDLGFLKYVTAVGTQGAISKETNKHYYVKTFKVLVSTNGEDWAPVKQDGKHK
ncbi:neuropilin-1a-like, partial [Engraulis encrasicolus]|uniref:neuropilin-1a-like n=1 Tax=Engraulis encrasicolus TaxID=184585 RepID=UPI002FD674FE